MLPSLHVKTCGHFLLFNLGHHNKFSLRGREKKKNGSQTRQTWCMYEPFSFYFNDTASCVGAQVLCCGQSQRCKYTEWLAFYRLNRRAVCAVVPFTLQLLFVWFLKRCQKVLKDPFFKAFFLLFVFYLDGHQTVANRLEQLDPNL